MAKPDTNLDTAVDLLQRGDNLLADKQYNESFDCLNKGLEILLNIIKATTDEQKKGKLTDVFHRYLNIAESAKTLKNHREHCRSLKILNDSLGYSYANLFGQYLDEKVTQIVVEDPYVRTHHQCHNFVRFCELAVTCCKNLQTMRLLTTENFDNTCQQEMLATVKHNLHEDYKVTLFVEFSSTLHDRQIRLNNGWTVKIGRGLDYFKPPESKYSLSSHDLNLRKCYETTVDFFFSNNFQL